MAWYQAVEAVKVHHLLPRSHKVTHKRLRRVVACIDFRNSLAVQTQTGSIANSKGQVLASFGRPRTMCALDLMNVKTPGS
jgi:hypothetical protein